MKWKIGLLTVFLWFFFTIRIFACEDFTLFIYDDFSKADQDEKWKISQSYSDTIPPPSNWKTVNNDGILEITGPYINSDTLGVKYIPKKFSHQVRSLKIDFKFSSKSDDDSALTLFSIPYYSSINRSVGIEIVVWKIGNVAWLGSLCSMAIGATGEYMTKWYESYTKYIDLDEWYTLHICSDRLGNIYFGLYERDGTVISAISDDISSYMGEFELHDSMDTAITVNPPRENSEGQIRVDIDNVFIDHKSSYFTAEEIEEAYSQGYSDALAGSDCDSSQNPDMTCLLIDTTLDLELPCVRLGEDQYRVFLNHHNETNAWSLEEITKLEEEAE